MRRPQETQTFSTGEENDEEVRLTPSSLTSAVSTLPGAGSPAVDYGEFKIYTQRVVLNDERAVEKGP